MKQSPTENGTGWTKGREQLIIDQAPTLIHTARPDGFLDFFNQRWLEYLGVGQAEVEGRRWINAIHPDDVDGIVGKGRASLATGEPLEVKARVRRGRAAQVGIISITQCVAYLEPTTNALQS